MTPKIRIAERRAADLLGRAGWLRPPVDVQGLAAAEKVEVVFEPLENNVSALLVRAPDGRVRIGVNALHHPNRQRFSIAHELGHFVLHSTQPTFFVDDHMVYFRAGSSSEATDAREIEANAFAAALLMPEESLLRDLRDRPISALDEAAVRGLAQSYQVSAQALTIRLVNLGLISGLGGSRRT